MSKNSFEQSVLTVAQAIHNQRKGKSITQQQMALKLGVDQAVISRIENAEQIPSDEILCKLTKLLNFEIVKTFNKRGEVRIEIRH